MSEFLHDASFFVAAFAVIAIAWQAVTARGEPPSDHTGDILDPYDDDIGWGDDGDGDDD